ncbi:nitrous oxide reductase accessory protein NosL [Candidatus Reidiella endopervernicosa]|uniref:nitrous oxide reductase accessory protein NosL n=1 Tax=Candidatus Reidiella endopervernicosa TaxID=2738883 RepID=UPI001EEFF6FD|nr:nitrous oxide reductase accessory protein NosL [Candidatus Reidiella endopervernicosa]
MPKVLTLFTLLLIALLTGCSGEPETGPVEVKWDRDTCERCRMVLSDRFHSAQIRVFPVEKKRSRVYKFDDIGCALLWLEDKPWRDDPRTEIWVTDHRSGEWIDAGSAIYIPNQTTPMEYGLGAQPEPSPGGLGFEQAKQHIFELEARFNAHGTHLKENAEQRR